MLFPKTKASIVINNTGNDLGGVEANAQVNKIERITVNGKDTSITNKTVDITTPNLEAYSISKLSTAQAGYSTTYQLTKNGTKVGDYINIPKDMVVQSGSVKTVSTANSPVSGYKVGDKYIDLVLANATNSHIYILVTDLIDTYTAGTGINISSNQISINLDILKKTFAVSSTVTANLNLKADKSTSLAGYGIANAYTKTEIDNKFAGLNYLTYEELA